jgi:hypothetical protein
MAWDPSSITIGGETFVEADFAPFAFATTWPRFLEALRQHAADVADLAGIQQATSVGGTGAAYTYSVASTLLSGQGLWFRPHTNNTGACTADGKPIKRSDGSDPAADELVAGTEYLLRYDGTNLRVLSLNVALAALSRLTPAADRLPYFTAAAGAALATFTSFARTLLAAADAAAARTVLGAQQADATLDAVAGLATAADRVPYFTGTDTAALATFTSFARTLVAAVDAAAARTVLGAQQADDTLTALAGLDTVVGAVEQTSADTFTKRPIGVGASNALLTRADGDGRFLGIAMVQVATNVATSDGGVTWTYDAPAEVPDGGILFIRFPSANAASGSGLTAQRNGDATARSLRNSDGSQITSRWLIRPNRDYVARRNGAVLHLTNLDLVQFFLNRVRLIGATTSIEFQDNDDQVGLARILTAYTQVASLTTTASTADGNAVLTFASTTGLWIGMRVTGTGIPAGATIAALTGTTVTLSAASVGGVANGASIAFLAGDRLAVFVEGNGVNSGTLALDVRASGIRGPAGAGFVNDEGQQYFHPANPPIWWKDIQAHLELLRDGYWEDQLNLVQVSGGDTYTLSATDTGLDVTAAGQVILTRGMAIGQDATLHIRAGASATIIAPQLWAGTEDSLARGNAQLGDVTSDATASTFTFTAGNPVTEGWRIGDVLRATGLPDAGNNGVDFTIIGFGGTSNRTVTVDRRPITNASPDSSYTFTRQGSRQLALTPGYYVIRREQTRFVADQRNLFTTVATTALPTPTYILPPDGQSWAVRMARYMVRGLEETLPLLGLSRSIHIPEGTAFGASSRINTGSNYLWDHLTNSPGPNYAAMRDALLNDHHVRAAGRVMFFLQHGLGDLINFSAAGTNKPQDIIDASIAIANQLETDTGLTLEWIVSPGPPAQDIAGIYPEDRWWPMRDAYVRLTEADPRFFLGPEFYDLLRNKRGERHHPFQEMRRFGRRLALSIAEHTNRLKNRLVTGAVAGTPGTMPTNWSLTVGSGLTRQVVGSGTVSGRPYVDIRVHGTATSTTGQLIAFEAANTVTAKSGQTWTASGWLSIVAGSTAGLNALRMSVVGTNGSSNIEDTDTSALATISGTPTRFVATRQLNNGSTTHVRGGIEYTYSNGAVIDFTIRIEGPQLERGATASALCLPQWMGPEFIAFEELAADQYRWTLDYGIGTGLEVPSLPAGVALLPPGSSQFATPLEVVRYQRNNGPGTTFHLTTWLKTPLTGARPAFPWGSAENLQAPSRQMRAFSAVIGDYLPVRTLRRSLLGL